MDLIAGLEVPQNMGGFGQHSTTNIPMIAQLSIKMVEHGRGEHGIVATTSCIGGYLFILHV